MKKQISTLIILTALLSLSACGGNKTTAETAPPKVSNTLSETKNDISKEAASMAQDYEEIYVEADEDEEEESVEIEIPSIKEYSIGRGVFEFKTFDNKSYVYDIFDKKLYEKKYNLNYSTSNGSPVILGYGGGRIYEAGSDVPIFTFEEEINSYGGFRCHSLLLKETRERFSGDEYSIGCISDTGEWIMPMSSDNAFINSGYTDFDPISGTLLLCGDDYTVNVWYKQNVRIYDVTQDKFYGTEALEGYEIYASDIDVDSTNYCFLNYRGNEEKGIMVYDIKNDKIAALHDRFEYVEQSGENIVYIHNGRDSNGREAKSCLVYDSITGELICNYDLSEYDVKEIGAVTADAIMFSCRKDSTSYIVVLNTDGEIEFEPIKGDFHNQNGFDNIFVNSRQYGFVYNTKTKELIKDLTIGNDEQYQIVGSDSSTGTLVIKAEDSRGYFLGYCLADADDPTNLYSPFERAE